MAVWQFAKADPPRTVPRKQRANALAYFKKGMINKANK